ncbi:MAG: hypothetical protein WCZ23_15185 [Rhodospirillaceae bacterium]
MLYAFIAGFGVLFAIVMMVNWFNAAEPKEIIRGLKWAALGVLVVAFVLLLVTGRLGWALAALAAIVPLGARLLRLLVLGQMARGAFSRLGGNPFGGLGGSQSRPGPGASTVSSRYLEMTLDHVTGRMHGRVLEGPLAGRLLADLSEVEALALWHAVATDPDSQRLLEAWMDRVYPEWREAAQGQGHRASSSGTMTRQEALDVLGLADNTDDDQVRAAYRRLMARAHPDQGGSTWMAAKLNEARSVLLGNDK